MDQLQEWFEKIVGVAPETRGRRELAEALFSRQPFDTAPFRTPACWRRKAVSAFPRRGVAGR